MQNNVGNSAGDWAAEIAQERASRKYPKAWYQNRNIQQTILILIGICVTVYQLRAGRGNVPHWFIVLGLTAFLGGWLADMLTTAYAFRMLPEYKKRGLKYPIVERNPFLTDHPTLTEQILSMSSIIKLGALLLTPVIPALGWGGAWSGLSAALNNRRNAESVNFQLQQYDLLMNGVENEKRYPRISHTQTGLTSKLDDHHNRIVFS